MGKIPRIVSVGLLAWIVLVAIHILGGGNAQADSPLATVGISLSSDSVTQGTGITVTMSFTNLESNSDTSDTDYIFRADVVDADQCEDQAGGYGLGVDRYMYKVDEDPEVRTGTISAACPVGDYTVVASLLSANNVELASGSASFSIVERGETEPEFSADATLRTLTLSSVTLAFDSATTGYIAGVANGVDETTVTPTTNDDGATYEIKLDGAADADGVILLAVGENEIGVVVTAEDGETTRTYTVTVTRAAPPLSADATLRSLALSGVTLAFDSATTGYAVSVANDVDETTVTLTTNDDGATYAIKLGGAADTDGVVQLSVGGNVITIEVTAEDGNTALTYTVTVTRAEPPTSRPAVSIGLSPSGFVAEGTEITVTMSFANLESDSDTSDTDYIFRADVVNSDQCENQAGGYGLGVERYMYKVDEDPETRRGTVSDACPPGDYTLEVSISSPDNVELTSATADFTITGPAQQQQDQEPQPSADATLSDLALSDVNVAFASTTTEYTASVVNSVTQTTVIPTTNDGGATYTVKLGDVSDVDEVILLAVGGNVITVEVTAEDRETARTYTVSVTRAEAPPELSADATLSGLALSDVNFGVFAPATTGYGAEVGNDVAETTVTPAANDDRATYVVQLNGGADADGVIPLAVGSNVIAVVVTAEDGNTAKTYTVTVTRAAPESEGDESNQESEANDPPVVIEVDLTTTEILTAHMSQVFVSFSGLPDSQTSYTFRADADFDECEHEGFGFNREIKGNGFRHYASLWAKRGCELGSHTFTVSVISSDNSEVATKLVTFNVTSTGAGIWWDDLYPDGDPYEYDGDVNAACVVHGGIYCYPQLKSLELNDVTLAFDKATTEYTADVPNDVSETTVTTTTNGDVATLVVKLDGVADEDGTVSLAVGENVITIEVTSEDGQITKTYTITVTRAAPPLSADATLRSLALSGVTLAFDSATTGYAASVANDVDETTVTLTTNDDGATYAIKLGGVSDADGTVSLAVGSNDITIEVTAEDGNTALTYTVTVTRAPAPTDEPAPSSSPDVPDTPTGEVTGKGQVRLDWNDVEGAAYYQVRFWKAAEWVELPTDEIGIVIDGSSATVSNLPNYGFCYFSVRAGNAAGLSDWSEFLTLATPEQ